MKILGCFKVVPDLDLVADEDWRTGGGLAVDTSYVKPVWNCFDEGALEMMLRLSDYGREAESRKLSENAVCAGIFGGDPGLHGGGYPVSAGVHRRGSCKLCKKDTGAGCDHDRDPEF